jgi:hypothetical protein
MGAGWLGAYARSPTKNVVWSARSPALRSVVFIRLGQTRSPSAKVNRTRFGDKPRAVAAKGEGVGERVRGLHGPLEALKELLDRDGAGDVVDKR